MMQPRFEPYSSLQNIPTACDPVYGVRGGAVSFWISTIGTDWGHEFQVGFTGMSKITACDIYASNPQVPQLNGKVERSHRTDQTEFYQLMTCTDNSDLKAKLKAWEIFYNYDRPHLSLNEKTPYEVMKSLLQ